MTGKTLKQIKKVQDEYTKRLQDILGVKGTGIEDNCRLIVYIDSGGSDPQGEIRKKIEEKILETLKGSALERSGIVFEYSGEIALQVAKATL